MDLYLFVVDIYNSDLNSVQSLLMQMEILFHKLKRYIGSVVGGGKKRRIREIEIGIGKGKISCLAIG